MASVITVHGLSKKYRVPLREPGLRATIRHLLAPQYREVIALQDISFTLEAGEAVGYLGPNGAGKTTTLKILAGVLYPDQGDVRVLGFVPFEGHAAFKKRIAFVMGRKGQLWWDLPALDMFRLFQEIYQVPETDFRRRLDELAARFRVSHLLTTPVRNLSLGERTKMELIAALLHGPQVLFLDEPTLGLDVLAQHEIRTLLRTYVREQGLTLLMASHYMRDVEALCDRVILLDQGRIRFDGPLHALKARYAPYREVIATLASPPQTDAWPAPTWLVERAGPRLRWRVPRDEVPRLLQQLTTAYEVTDLTVHEPALEDILRQMYSHEALS
ncbi:MAG: ATP-binding cassette domain-containing protein [Chloroflexi bacterium]|nr:ATP-binding cassette domain-containing protein [Chloroflexota bacterium]